MTKKQIKYSVDQNGCHICTSHCLDREGFPIMVVNKRQLRVARVVLMRKLGEMPSARLRRLCGEPLCVNPDHMEIVSKQPKGLAISKQRKRRTAEDRFWDHVDKTDDDSMCWEWSGGKRKNYGRLKIAPGQGIDAHRFSYILHYGPIPEGRIICHKCNNPRCVNPSHLYAGTYKDNHKDSVEAGTASYLTNFKKFTRTMFQKNDIRLKGSAHPTSKLTEELVRQIRQRAANGETHRTIAASLGLGKTIVTDVKNRKRWGWVD